MQVQNEEYLRTHPELAALLSHFVNLVLVHQPIDLYSFAKGTWDVFISVLIMCLLDVFGEGKYMGQDEGTQMPTREEMEGNLLLVNLYYKSPCSEENEAQVAESFIHS